VAILNFKDWRKTLKIDLHVHSMYSFDSFMSVDKIIKLAKKKDLNGIAIVDHNNIKGGMEGKKINKNKDFII